MLLAIGGTACTKCVDKNVCVVQISTIHFLIVTSLMVLDLIINFNKFNCATNTFSPIFT